MSCYHPLLRFETWEKYKCQDGHEAYKARIEKPNPYILREYETIEEMANSMAAHGRYRKIQVIPCGKCIGCRLEYSRDWATKGIYEAEQWKDNWFLTITYDNEHLPIGSEVIDPETGEEKDPIPSGTLRKAEFQGFIKKLRSYYERKYNHKGIRFMGCGEYGETYNRSHYHAIMFNLPIPVKQMKFHEYNEMHEALWRCPELEEIWGKGMIVAAEVNWNTCAYVARYITKKVGMPTDKDHYKLLGIEPEFFLMSRKPGIGRTYYEEHKEEIYEKDKVLIQKYGGGTMRIRPPRYYDKLYDLENPDKMKEIKEKRKKDQENISKVKYNQTTLYKKQQLKLEEDTKKSQSKALKRSKV